MNQKISCIASLRKIVGVTALTFFCSALLPNYSQAEETVYFHTWRATDKLLWDEVNRQNLIPGVRVESEMVLRAYYLEALTLLMQNNQADIFLWPPGAPNLAPLMKAGFIKPYHNSLEQMNKASLPAATGTDGLVYGVPFAVQMQSLMLNNKVVKKHGITSPPSSLSQLEQYFETLKSAGVIPLYFPGGEGWYIAQVVGEVMVAGLVDESFAQQLIDGEKCFNSNEYKIIFETLNSWVEKGYMQEKLVDGNYYEMYTSVSLGNAAMSLEGGWMTSKAEPYYSMDADYEFEFWPVPGKSAKFVAFGDGSFQMSQTTNELEATQKVLDFTATKKFAELFAKYIQQLPAYGGEIEIEPGDLKRMATILANESYQVSLFAAYSLNSGSPSYNDLFVKAVQGIVKGNKSPKQAVENIQEGLNNKGYIGAQACSM